MNPITTAVCDRCRGAYDLEAFFNLAGGRADAGLSDAGIPASRPRRTICAGCEQTAADRRKNERRAIDKANNTITKHARAYGMPRGEFARRYEWDVQRIAYDIEHAHENTCGYCWQPYAEMDGGEGLAVLTLDLVDPELEPYYRTNTRWCCRTCNAQKQRMAPELWARRLGAWSQWRAVQAGERLIDDQLVLFAGVE